MERPPCGLYRTTVELGSVPEGRLVYFHNHGDPGPGIYLPKKWQHNRAVFQEQGFPLLDDSLIDSLQPLPLEGVYRVEVEFHCCGKKCRLFKKGLLAQLGYNAAAVPILFEPSWEGLSLKFPDRGQRIDLSKLQHLKKLIVESAPKRPESNTLH